MTANDNAQPLRYKRSGSEKRQRHRKTDTRWDDDEYSVLTEQAQETGLSRNAYIRAVVLGTPGPRARRSPPIDAEAMGRAAAAR